jgi:hypothetical protein
MDPIAIISVAVIVVVLMCEYLPDYRMVLAHTVIHFSQFVTIRHGTNLCQRKDRLRITWDWP